MIDKPKKIYKFANEKMTMTNPKVENYIKEAINTKGIIDLNGKDFDSLLNSGDKAQTFLENGSGDSALNDVLAAIEKDAKQKGINIFDSKKILISISISSKENAVNSFMTAKLEAINEFIARFGEDFELKWGLYSSPALQEDEVRVLLITC